MEWNIGILDYLIFGIHPQTVEYLKITNRFLDPEQIARVLKLDFSKLDL